MVTVKLVQQQAKEALLLSSDTASLDVDILMSHCLQKSRAWLMTWPDATLTLEQQQVFDRYIDRRKKGEPVAYIVGEQEFWSLPLKVNEATLIPRPETELLVELALDRLAIEKGAKQDTSVLDLGTGSGAISLALKSERPHWHVTAVDFSSAALEVAKGNAESLQLDVCFIQSDWFQNVVSRKFDLIVSNPPYIDSLDAHLQQGDVCFEPSSALVAGENGYSDIRRICCDAQQYLNRSGLLMFEHGFEQGVGARKILNEYGFEAIETVKDLAGLDRVSMGRWGNGSDE